MTATINDLRRAIDSRATHFRRLARAMRRGDIVRTSYFAEVRMELQSVPCTLFMPLTGDAMARVERFAPLRRHLLSPAVPQIEILCDEMSYDDALARRRTCDVVTERLPQGRPLQDAMAAIFSDGDAAALIGAIDALEGELRRADVSHNNLRAENILIDDRGTLYPIRWTYATDGAGGDAEALQAIRAEIARAAAEAGIDGEAHGSYAPAIEGAYGIGTLEEGLAPVETEHGWGYVDGEGRIAIGTRFRWAGGFREGRAEVQTDTGMGLIDKRGRYVIEPRFDIVEYDHETGNSQVRLGSEWAVFDYSGRQTTPFATRGAAAEGDERKVAATYPE